MSIKSKPPSQSRLIGNVLLAVGGLFLIVNLLFPQLFAPASPKFPDSLFIDQVEDGNVARVSVGQNEIRYQLKNDQEGNYGRIFSTTPIFDLELPKRLEAKGVEFAAAPPPKNGWIGSVLSWVIPP
ncbi:MAG UNVERIFIED_CONTAM: ATP-dependent metallopeptidase FtsH/Yme1/Tma family protein [Microcystis novacekii LVE1205-3]